MLYFDTFILGPMTSGLVMTLWIANLDYFLTNEKGCSGLKSAKILFLKSLYEQAFQSITNVIVCFVVSAQNFISTTFQWDFTEELIERE